jgi:hypothetical protein
MRTFPEPAARPVDRQPRRGPSAAVRIRVPVAPRGDLLLAVAMAGLAWLASPGAHASTFRWFTDQSQFIAALEPGGYYAATGTILSGVGGEQSSPQNRTDGTFGFDVSSTSGLVGLPGPGVAGIQPLEAGTPLTFSLFTPPNGVQAFGGLFSLTDDSEARSPGQIQLQILGPALSTGTAANIIGATNTFLGFISDDVNVPITSVMFSTSASLLYATAETIIVGVPVAPVPEPSTLAGAGVGALVLGIAYRRRRRAARGRAVAAESET